MCWKSLSVFSSCCYCLPKKKVIIHFVPRRVCHLLFALSTVVWSERERYFECVKNHYLKCQNDNTRHSTSRYFLTSNERRADSRQRYKGTNKSKERWRFDSFIHIYVIRCCRKTLQIFEPTTLKEGKKSKHSKCRKNYHRRAQKTYRRWARRMWIFQPSQHHLCQYLMTLFSDVNDEDPPPGEKGKSSFHGWWTQQHWSVKWSVAMHNFATVLSLIEVLNKKLVHMVMCEHYLHNSLIFDAYERISARFS